MMRMMIRHVVALAVACVCANGAWAGEPVAASVTTNGVTTTYATLEAAWADALTARGANIDATVKLLQDAAVESSLRLSYAEGVTAALTLDLNDHVLAHVGADLCCIIDQNGGALNVIDTATTRTPRYFTCDGTGLWTLTNEVTDLAVSGGLLTGGRGCAIDNSYPAGNTCISNVNFVGNSSTVDGGAVKMTYDEVTCTLIATTFIGNSAKGNGGAIAAGCCTMTDCRVEANVAAGRGGGAYVRCRCSLVRTEVAGNRAGTGGGICVEKAASGCFPAGTKVLMADGTEKNIESVAEGDVVATFDHVGGTNSSAAVFYVYRGTQTKHVFTLTFASGTTLDVADRHDLVLETARKYVTVSSDNARSYLGRRFYNYTTGGWDELVGVESAEDCETYYSIYTRGHGNSVANGLLTVPDDKDCFVNVYELDENLKADAAQLAADIATYGLATPADYPNVPPGDFEDGNNRYAFIAIGKGLTTQEELLFWFEYDYGPVVVKKAASARKLMMASAMPKLSGAAAIPSPSEPCLKVGEGVVVTGNVSTAAGIDNVYLGHTTGFFGKVYEPVIEILPEASGIDVGVTLSTTNGVFGWTNEVNYATSFTSDNPDYAVTYTADKTLELIVPPFEPVASVTTNGVTTLYDNIYVAWGDACTGTEGNPATMRLLKDASLRAALVTVQVVQPPVLALDLDGHVLRPTEEYTGSLIVSANAGEKLTVRNGTLTGAKRSAIDCNYEMALENLVLTGNSAENGGAICCGMNTQLLVKDCVITNNSASAKGGAIYRKDGTPVYEPQDKMLLIRTLISDNTAGEAGGGVYFQKTTQCLAAGTLVRMADGSEKPIENVVEGDVVKTFDHEGGTNSTARVYYAFKGPTKSTPVTLEFEGDATRSAIAPCRLAIVGQHDLLEMESRRYVTITAANVENHIGRKFYGEDGAWHTLTGVTRGTTACEYYSLYTAQHMNLYADGMLTVADDVDFLLNLYTLDENLKADAVKLAADIATYGLVSPDYAEENFGVPKACYDDANVKYYRIAYGKGLTTRARVLALFADMTEGKSSEPCAVQTAASPKTVLMSLMSANADPTLDDATVGALTLGEGVVVTNNFANGQTANVYLHQTLIGLTENHGGICVGVAHSDGVGQFTADMNVTAADVALFTSDDPEYVVRHDAEGGFLKLGYSGVQVGDDAWARVADGTCTIRGSGAMWDHGEWTAGNPLADMRTSIRSVVVSDGVTSVGSRFFHKFYAITNVHCAASVTAVGDHAFYRCASLQAMSFAGADAPTFGTNAYTMHAGISIKDGMPDVYAIPEITVSGYAQCLYGRASLSEGEWEKVTTEAQRRDCRFFKIVLEK